MTQSRWIVVGVLFVVGGGALIALWGPSQREPLEVVQPTSRSRGATDSRAVDADYVMVGGIRRPASDVGQPVRKAESEERPSRDFSDYGATTPVSIDLNPHVISVVSAIRAKQHPERVSALATPPAFDAQKYAENPQAYLETVEPGRVYQVAQPGPDVPQLMATGPRIIDVIQGGDPALLEVQATPGAPVTFTSFDLGEFSNRLTTITVAADEQGIARAEFYGTPGTIDDIKILAGSPVTSGQVTFVVYVTLPE